MTELLYLKDHYLKEFQAEVKEANGVFIILDKTGFYPSSGGQPSDFGKIFHNNQEYKVLSVKKVSQEIQHELNKNGIKIGDKIKGVIDWERRYKLMRAHTAAHIISEVIHKETKALITGNQLDIDKIRIDFSLENFDKEKMQRYIERANEIIQQDLPITTEFLTREEALKLPQISKLAMGLPEAIKEVRILKIGEFDLQADGGTHVKSTKEIRRLEFISTENKGKANRRLYFKLLP